MHRPEYPCFSILFFLALVEIMKAHWELRATRWQEPGSWTTTWSSYPNKICVWGCYMWCYYDTNSFFWGGSVSVNSSCVTFLVVSPSLSSRSTSLLPFCSHVWAAFDVLIDFPSLLPIFISVPFMPFILLSLLNNPPHTLPCEFSLHAWLFESSPGLTQLKVALDQWTSFWLFQRLFLDWQ